MDDGQGRRSDTLVSVNLPPLPRGQAFSPLLNHALPPLPSRPGTAVRLRPPTPPPRPDASLTPPPVRTLDGGAAPLLFSSLPGAGGRPSLDLPADQTITLTNPRTVRQQNVYVETPMKGLLRDDCIPPAAVAVKRPRVLHPHHPKQKSSNPSNAVITQPLAAACKKVGPPPPIAPTSPTDSIMCGECGRCRCAACRSARPHPTAGLCVNWCECSAETVLDYVTCMCCVKAGLYHCGEALTGDPDTRDQTWVDKPCSCTSSKRLLRWGCLAVLSIPLPCLLCYPLLKGATKVAEKCYQSATTTGCRCTESAAPPHPASASPTDSQKRLLS